MIYPASALVIAWLVAPVAADQSKTCGAEQPKMKSNSLLQYSSNAEQVLHMPAAAIDQDSCDANWEQETLTSENSLRATRRIIDASNDIDGSNYQDHVNDLPYGGVQGLFLMPEHNFLFCIIEKNGCSTWTKVFTKMWHNNAEDNENNMLVGWETETAYNNTNPGIPSVFADPDATRAVFVRDPLSRFASAYLEKCLAYSPNPKYCPPTKPGITFADAVDWAKSANMTLLDGHFQLQADHCALRKYHKAYNTIGLMTKHNLAHDASCLLHKSGLNQFNTKGARFMQEPVWNPEVDPVVNTKMGVDEEDILRKLYTPESARAMMVVLHDDYEMFGFPEPEWINEATGEWHNQNVPVRASLLDVGAESHDAALQGVDDLVELAKLTGFLK